MPKDYLKPHSVSNKIDNFITHKTTFSYIYR